MIYVTGDTHASYEGFGRKRMPYSVTANDYIIVCGDFGLLWDEEAESLLRYNLKFFESKKYTILWVSGNHENYNMIAKYPKSFWNGGMVRHIIKDKVILLERGQVFNIEGKRFFTFGGASSHDVQGGILDRADPDFIEKRRRAYARNLPFRIKNESWWEAELPTAQEMETGMENLKKAEYQVDYVITHCAATRIQEKAELIRGGRARYETDVLTEYFEKIEACLQYQHWFCGHYHINARIDKKHTVLYEEIIPLEAYMKCDAESAEEEDDW